MKNDDAIQFEPTKNANIFKDFYSDLAGTLVRKFSVAFNKFNNNSRKQYYMNIEKRCHNIELWNETIETIKKILVCLDSSKVSGLDEISSKFLKDGAEVLALLLCNLVNLSIKQSLFPDQHKIAKLKSLFKKGSKSDSKNYRHISLLPVASKIIEKTIQIQTQEWLTLKMANFISISQGFTRIFQWILAFYNLPILFWEEWTKDFTLGWS